MKKNLLSTALIALTALFSMPQSAWADAPVAVSKTATWTFSTWTTSTSITEVTALESSEGGSYLYVLGNSTSGHNITGESGNQSLTLSDGTSITSSSPTIYANSAGQSTNPSANTAANSTSIDRCFAFKTSVAGTCYVALRFKNNCTSKTLALYYNGTSVDSYASQGEVTGNPDKDLHELKYEATAGGTFFIKGDAEYRVAMIKFVPAYSLTLNTADNGSVSAAIGETSVTSGSNVAVGKTVTLTANPSDGYRLKSLTVKDGNETEVSKTTVTSGFKYTFAMPSSAATVTATFEKIKYTLTSSATNGTVVMKKGSDSGSDISSGTDTEWGTNVYVSATPTSDSYYLSSLTYGGTSMDNNSTFEMPQTATEVVATFVAKTVSTVEGLAAATPTYNGSAQNLVTTPTVSGGTIYYSTTSATEGFTTNIPTGTDAGSYSVWYKVEGDATHTDIAATEITGVSIAKYDITNATIDGTIADQTHTGSELTPTAPAIKMGETTIDASNYEVSYSNNINVGTATVTYTANAGSTNFTGTTTLNFNIVSGATPTHSVSVVTSTGDDTYGTVSATSDPVAEGGTTTVTAVPATGYQVTSWAVSGTGATIDPSGESNSNTTTLTMGTADATVTVTFGPKSYTVTLDNQSATTAGTASVKATYNASTNLTSNITCPAKTGYIFGGYYTAENGGGTQLINSNGAWIASVSDYTDGSTNWVHDGAVTLYAKWTAFSLAAFSGTKTFTSESSDTWTGTTKNIPQYSPATGSQFMALSAGENMAVNNSYGLQLGKVSGGALVFYVGAESDITVNVKTNTTCTVKLDYMGTSTDVLTTSNYNTAGTSCDSKELTSTSTTGTLTKSGGAAGYYKVYSTALMGITSLSVTTQAAATTYSVSAVTSTGNDTYGTVSAEATSLEQNGTTTITAVPATGYQVTNWAVSGTDATIDPSGDSNSNTTTLTMGTADATVTVTFGPKSYTVTLDNQSATTAGTAGVAATYNASTNLTSNITCPEKTSYTFGGYYTETSGSGTQLIDGSGAWIASVSGYTDADKKWVHDGDVTLYAKWTSEAPPTPSGDVWTVNDVTVESYTTLTQKDDVWVHGNSTSGHAISVVSESVSGTFTNGTSYSATKFLRIPNAATTDSDPIESAMSSRRLAGVDYSLKEYLAIDVAQAGTLYAIYKPSSNTSERNIYLGFQKADNNYSKTTQAVSSTSATEIKHTCDGAGTYFLYGSIEMKVYAIMFVPSGTSYKLTTVVDPSEAGNVKRVYSEQETTASQFASGSTVKLTAEVASGAAYEFTKWTDGSGSDLSTDNPYTVTMDAAKTVKAVFSAVISYTLTTSVSPDGGGTIVKKIGDEVTEATSFKEGTSLTITAKHKAGYKFAGWSGAITSTEPTITLTMDAAKTLTATFEAVSVYDTYDFREWAGNNVTSSTGLVDITWDEGDLVSDGKTMTLNNAFSAGTNVKIRNNDKTSASTGLIMQDNKTDNLTLQGLNTGDWFKIESTEGALKFSGTNVRKYGATSNVANGDYLISGDTYLVTEGTSVSLTFGGVKAFTNSGSHSYIYNVQISNAAIPPSVVYKGLEDGKAVYTVTYDAAATLYYKLPGASDFASTTDGTESGGVKTIELTCNQSGTLEVYSKKDSADSEHVTETVTVVQNATVTLTDDTKSSEKTYTAEFTTDSSREFYYKRPQDTSFNHTKNSPVTMRCTDNGELEYYIKEGTTESKHDVIIVNTIITRPSATLKTLGEEKSVYTLTFSTGNTVTYKVPDGSDKTVSEGKSLDIDITKSGQLIAYATMGSLKSDSLKTNVYVKTPAIAANGKYDFSLLKDQIADYVLGTRPGETVTIGGLTLKQPDDVVENTLNRFAFTARYTEKTSAGTDRERDTDWRLLSAGRLRANKSSVADTMAILNLTKGQYLSIEYSGAELKYMSQSTAKLADGTDVLTSKQAYEILSDGALLLVVPANTDKTCDIFTIEVAGDESVTAPTLEARTESGVVVPNAITLRLGASNFGNTVTAYYTTDGTTPSATNGTAMSASGKVTVDETCTVKAICISTTGVASAVSEYAVTLPQADKTGSVVYDFNSVISKNQALTFSTTAASSVQVMEKGTSGWEQKGRSDFYPVTDFDSRISVRVGAESVTYDTEAATVKLIRPMAIHNLGVGDEIVIMYSGTGSVINVNSPAGDVFTVADKTVAVGEEISSGAVIKITKTKYANNYIVVGTSGDVYINAIYINSQAPSTVTRPKVALKDVDGDEAIYNITFDAGARLYYWLSTGEETAYRGSDTGSYDLTISKSATLKAWAQYSGLVSDTLTTVVYAPTPAPSENGDYDFAESSDGLPADMEVQLDAASSVTVSGKTLYKPTALTEQTFQDKFAFTETNTSGKIKIRTNRQLAFSKGTDMNMALLNMKKGDIIAFDYTGTINFANPTLVKADAVAAARAMTRGDSDSQMASGTAYVVQQDCNVLMDLVLTSEAVSIAKMYVAAAPGKSDAAAVDFASAAEDEEELEMGGAASVWCAERTAMVKFKRLANSSDNLPIDSKISSENGYGSNTTSGFTSGNRNIAIHALAKGDTIKVRFSGGDVLFYNHASYGNSISRNGKLLVAGDTIHGGDVLKVEKVDYLNNYFVLRLGSGAAISGIFINKQETEKVLMPTATLNSSNALVITSGKSTLGYDVVTNYTTNGTDPSLLNGTGGPYATFEVQLRKNESKTIKVISISESGAMSRILTLTYDGSVLTSIEDVFADREDELTEEKEAVIYDLLGRRVTTMTPGHIYIVNGKKRFYNKR